MLEARTLTYKDRVRDVSASFIPGALTALVGPNGAGKTTLLRLLAGGLCATEGNVFLEGQPLSTWDEQALARQRAVLPQAHGLGFNFEAQAIVALGCMPSGREDFALVKAVMASLAIEPLWGRRYLSLSGGEQQLVHLARVLVQIKEAQGVRVLLLDEPTASLDLRYQEIILEAARQQAEEGAIVVMALHDLSLAHRFADKAVMLNEGCLIVAGEVSEVLNAERVAAVYQIKNSEAKHFGVFC
tara:strand:+ start:18159 stop:18887 length:729 start_codon:yes stop_codon:yes gene_type:complete